MSKKTLLREGESWEMKYCSYFITDTYIISTILLTYIDIFKMLTGNCYTFHTLILICILFFTIAWTCIWNEKYAFVYKQCIGLIYYYIDAYVFIYYPLRYLDYRWRIYLRTLLTQGKAGICCPQLWVADLGQAFQSVSGERIFADAQLVNSPSCIDS